MSEYIKREVVIGLLDDCIEVIPNEEAVNPLIGKVIIKAARKCVEKIPSVDVEERKRGEWMPQDNNKQYGGVSTCIYTFPKCSLCGKAGDYRFGYCPYCGAKMEEDNG